MVRFAIVGVGAHVFNLHLPALQSNNIDIVGVSDVDVAAAAKQAERLGCPHFAGHREMVAATRPEAVAVLAPHPFHASIAADCLSSGAHVLVEKPLAVEVAEADRMVEAARAADRLLGVNLQHRTRADIRTARKLIASGRLGRIQRVEMEAIWTRTAAYYAQAGWRGTWQGEGGGVLMNQSPHTLDLICYLVGQPSRVVAWNRTQFHDIETEDTSLALLEWADGSLGTLLVTTAQAGEPERLEIGGSGGILRLGRDGLHFLEAEQDLRTFLAQEPGPFARPKLESRDVPLESGSGDHTAIYANFCQAIEHGEPLVADGEQGRQSLELANALIYSSATQQQVSLPLDRQAYATLLADLRASASP